MYLEKTILIPIPAHFSFEECMWFLDRNYDDCLHVIRNGVIYKALETGEGNILISISRQGSMLEINVLAGDFSREISVAIAAYVSEWFDMQREIEPFYHLLRTEGRLAYMAEEFAGLRLIGISSIYEAICWSIIGQQINLSFAYKCKRRMVEAFGAFVAYEGSRYYLFPKAETLANVPFEDYKAMQFSKQKADYIINISERFASGEISKDLLLSLPDFEARRKFLTSFKGIGIWTANYALMKSLGEPEAVPYGDVGLLNALANHNIIHDRKDLTGMHALFSQFSGWETYLVFYLWRSLTHKKLG